MVWLKDEKEVFPHTCFSSPASPCSLSTDASWSRGPLGWLFILSASFWFLLLMVESRNAVSVLDPALVLPVESRERERREKRETERKGEGDREGERDRERETARGKRGPPWASCADLCTHMGLVSLPSLLSGKTSPPQCELQRTVFTGIKCRHPGKSAVMSVRSCRVVVQRLGCPWSRAGQE